MQQAYPAYDAADAAAYKQTRDYSEYTGNEPRNTGTGAPAKALAAPAGAYPYAAASEGASCTSNGAPGHLRTVNGKLECVPDRRQDAATFDAKAAAYDEYDREMATAICAASNDWTARARKPIVCCAAASWHAEKLLRKRGHFSTVLFVAATCRWRSRAHV